MDEIKNLLDEQIKTEISGLSSLKTGSDEKSKAVADLTKLYQARIDEKKAETALLEHQDRHELERDKYFLESQTQDEEMRFKRAQYKAQNLDRWVNVGIQVGLTVLSIVSYDIWLRKGLKFEETGTVTSPQTRNLISKMLPSFKK